MRKVQPPKVKAITRLAQKHFDGLTDPELRYVVVVLGLFTFTEVYASTGRKEMVQRLVSSDGIEELRTLELAEDAHESLGDISATYLVQTSAALNGLQALPKWESLAADWNAELAANGGDLEMAKSKLAFRNPATRTKKLAENKAPEVEAPTEADAQEAAAEATTPKKKGPLKKKPLAPRRAAKAVKAVEPEPEAEPEAEAAPAAEEGAEEAAMPFEEEALDRLDAIEERCNEGFEAIDVARGETSASLHDVLVALRAQSAKNEELLTNLLALSELAATQAQVITKMNAFMAGLSGYGDAEIEDLDGITPEQALADGAEFRTLVASIANGDDEGDEE